MMPVARYVIHSFPSSTVWRDSALPESLPGTVAPSPGKLIHAAAARPAKISRETLIGEATWPVGDGAIQVAVKQYLPRTPWKVVSAMFRPAKAVQNWRKAEFLLAHDIATPRPLLACRPHGWAASSTSFLATEWIAGAENLHTIGWRIAAWPLAERLRFARRCAAALGRLVGRIHNVGAAHRDLKAANLLAVQNERDVNVYLVDLDGLQIGHLPVGVERKARDLARLAAGLTAHAWVTRSVALRFIREYLREFPTEMVAWKPLWRAVAKETAKYVARKLRRGQRVL
jgi:tRNA A-37 threonylcarbamoyl transferase component Bud32